MNIGDYVRTIKGKIYKLTENDLKFEMTKQNCKISSPNIIHILEVGDYVNGHKVLEKNNYYVEVESEDIQSETWEKIYCNDIKSILTKECFESMEYKL